MMEDACLRHLDCIIDLTWMWLLVVKRERILSREAREIEVLRGAFEGGRVLGELRQKAGRG